ncbi:hypothetical protein RRG08_007284, partial [Elysia crispata]
ELLSAKPFVISSGTGPSHQPARSSATGPMSVGVAVPGRPENALKILYKLPKWRSQFCPRLIRGAGLNKSFSWFSGSFRSGNAAPHAAKREMVTVNVHAC